MALYTNVSHLIYIVCSPIVSSVFVVLNILTIIIFITKFRLASLSLVVMMNICICDIAVCLISNNFYVINLVHPTFAWATGTVACKLFKTLTMMCNLCQIFSFVVLCLDRMRRLTTPTNPQWRKKHGLIFLVIIWAFSIALTGGRFVLFKEKEIKKFNNVTNLTEIVNYACKPAGINTIGYAVMTILQFAIGYFIPLCIIIGTIVACEFNIRRNMKLITEKISNSTAMKMNRQLSNVFNTTAMLFLLIWTPFFVMSILDLSHNLVGNKNLTHLNFSFRCTLLVAGSGKPLIYIIALKRFRNAMCGNLCRTGSSIYRETETSSIRGSSLKGSTKGTSSTSDPSSAQGKVHLSVEKAVSLEGNFNDISNSN